MRLKSVDCPRADVVPQAAAWDGNGAAWKFAVLTQEFNKTWGWGAFVPMHVARLISVFPGVGCGGVLN